MARPLTPDDTQRPRRAARRTWATAAFVALVLHVVGLDWLSNLMQPPSLLKEVPKPFYTRTITPEAVTPPETSTALAPPPSPVRPSIRIASSRPAQPTAKTAAKKAPQRPASAPPAAEPPPAEPSLEQPAQESVTESLPLPPPSEEAEAPAPIETPEKPVLAADTSADPAPAAPSASDAPPASPSEVADSTPPAYLASWPTDTRLRYRLGGNYRGELYGNAEVLWQREGTRYQAVIQLDVGFLLSSRFASQGEITEGGLRPEVYEEQIRKKRRGVRLGDDVRLDNGNRVPRPQDVQDAASQFVELGHRFATGQVRLEPGSQINFWLARPGGVDEWTYDVVDEDTVYLPRLGPVPAIHLKPRPLARPRGPIMAEIWFAPSMQYLPIRILLTSGPETYVDLVVETVEQK